MYAIEARELVKRYGDVRAVDGLSFAAAPGEILALLGTNGAGKSTAVQVLAHYLICRHRWPKSTRASPRGGERARMYAIEARELVKRYGGICAVNGLSFAVTPGEILALLGANGAGKSTAVRMLAGLTPPDGGDALLMGYSVVRERAAVRRIVGVSPQESALAPRLSVRENLEFIAGLHGLPRSRAGAALEAYGLAGVADRRAGMLSGGWQRRLSIAMALLPGPEILFLDEPTLGLDVPARRELWRLIEGLRGRTTVLLTTHYLEEAEALSDRIAILRAGKLAALGTAREVTAQVGAENFEEAFLKFAGEGGTGI